MTDNRAGYGFRFYRSRWGRALENPIRKLVASNTTFAVSGGVTAAGLGSGDPVQLVNDGSVTLATGTEGTTDNLWGIVVAVGPYWTGQYMLPDKVIPSATVWGTNLDRASFVWVVPIEEAYWEIDVNDATTFTTETTYLTAIGENCSMILTGAANNGPNRVFPKLNISTHATTNTLKLRIEELSTTKDNADFAGLNVKMVVSLNVGTQVASLATTSTGV